jgi:hypothetical protein
LLKCISKEEGAYILREIHEGVCTSHVEGRVLADKAMRMGYFWLGMYAKSMEMVQKCKKCQLFASVPSIPLEKLTPISSKWPFAQWGVDVVSPLSTGKGVKFSIVAVDYFTKSVEAESLTCITT